MVYKYDIVTCNPAHRSKLPRLDPIVAQSIGVIQPGNLIKADQAPLRLDPVVRRLDVETGARTRREGYMAILAGIRAGQRGRSREVGRVQGKREGTRMPIHRSRSFPWRTLPGRLDLG